jgi:hypothetical protein
MTIWSFLFMTGFTLHITTLTLHCLKDWQLLTKQRADRFRKVKLQFHVLVELNRGSYDRICSTPTLTQKSLFSVDFFFLYLLHTYVYSTYVKYIYGILFNLQDFRAVSMTRLICILQKVTMTLQFEDTGD